MKELLPIILPTIGILISGAIAYLSYRTAARQGDVANLEKSRQELAKEIKAANDELFSLKARVIELERSEREHLKEISRLEEAQMSLLIRLNECLSRTGQAAR